MAVKHPAFRAIYRRFPQTPGMLLTFMEIGVVGPPPKVLEARAMQFFYVALQYF